MALDNYVCKAIADELKAKLVGGRIEKIYQPTRSDFILGVANNRIKHNLLLSAEPTYPKAHLSSVKFPMGDNSYAFLMAARKHIGGGRITDIYAISGERIIDICINKHSELGEESSLRLVVELLGRHSNIFLVDEADGKIVDVIRRVSFDIERERQALPKLKYALPQRSKGISPLIEAELCLRGEAYQDVLQDLADNQAYEPTIYQNLTANKLDFHVFSLQIYEDDPNYQSLRYNDVSEMLEAYYSMKTLGNQKNQRQNELERLLSTVLKKQEKRLQNLKYDLTKAQKLDEYKQKADAIMANIYLLKKGDKLKQLVNFSNSSPDSTAKPTEIEVALDENLTPSENAQTYYNKYNKSKRAIENLEKLIEQNEAQLAYISEYESFLANARTYEDLGLLSEEIHSLAGKRDKTGYKNGKTNSSKNKKKNKKLKRELLTFYSTNDTRIWVGRNNAENDYLSLQFAKDYYVWLHTKDIPGSHVILETFETDCLLDEVDDSSLREAASIAAYFSKARHSSNVPVDYAFVKHLKKPAGSRPGKVIFKHNKTIYVNPMTMESSE